MLGQALRALESTGAEVVGIACNSAHLYFDKLRRTAKAAVLSIVEESAAEASAIGARRVAILGSAQLGGVIPAVRALVQRGSGLEAGWFGEVRWLRALHAKRNGDFEMGSGSSEDRRRSNAFADLVSSRCRSLPAAGGWRRRCELGMRQQ